MKRIYKTETIRRVLQVVLLMCIITPGLVWSAEVEQVSVGPITADFAIMWLGQSKTFTVESDLYPAIMIIPVVLYGTGNLSITVTKTDTSGELFGVLQVGGYNPIEVGTKSGATVGVTPRTIILNSRFYDTGFIVVMSGLLASFEEGPHRYSINLNVF